jgi:hypothetical protein
MKRMISLRMGAAATLGLAIALVVAPGYSQTQGMERRDDHREDRGQARDTRQGGRDEARDLKEKCKEGDTSRAECRQLKRETKQDARGEARDTKTNDSGETTTP